MQEQSNFDDFMLFYGARHFTYFLHCTAKEFKFAVVIYDFFVSTFIYRWINGFVVNVFVNIHDGRGIRIASKWRFYCKMSYYLWNFFTV